MNIWRWIMRIKGFVPGGQANELSSIQPQEQFRTSILRERRRVDRNQHMLSLLLFNIGDPEANSVAEQYLAHILANRIRSTDEVGWFESKHIGVILPYTYRGGTHKLADDICKAITSKASPPEYIVYTYPSNWFSNGSGHPAQSNIVDLSTKRFFSCRAELSGTTRTMESYFLLMKINSKKEVRNRIRKLARSPMQGTLRGFPLCHLLSSSFWREISKLSYNQICNVTGRC